MKQPKKLTRKQREFVHDYLLDPFDWMCVDDNENELIIINKYDGTIKHLVKEQ